MRENQTQPRSTLFGIGFASLILFQLLSTILCFKTPAELFRAAPIINIDWCSQYYWSFAARKFFSESHRLWGFDPYYMAGYPLDFIFNSALPVQAAGIIFRPVPLGLVIKWFFLLSFSAVPFIFYSSLRNFGLAKGASLAGAALGVSCFWLGEDALFGNWGMISGALLLNFFLLTASGFYRYLKSGDRRSFLLFVIYLTSAVLIHKTFIILAGLPGLILVLIFIRRIHPKVWLGIFGALVFACLLNSFWLIPFFHFLPNKIEDPNTSFFQNTIIWRFLADLTPYPYPGVALGRLMIFLPAVYGIIQMRKKPELKDLFRFTVFASAAFFILVYFGSFLAPLRHLQPYRYLTALFFLLLPASGLGFRTVQEKLGRNSQSVASGLGIGFFLLLLGLQFVPSYRVFYRVTPLTSQWPEKVKKLRAWMENNTGPQGRIMMEDINQWEDKLAPYGPSRFVGILPALLPRHLIGGPLPNAFIKHHYASFHDGLFLNQPMMNYSDQELKEKLELYNIHWAVTWTRGASRRLSHFPLAIRAEKFDDLEVFEFQIPPNWFLAGSGDLQADYDRIELRNLKPVNNLVVIKMHWLDGFRPEPACELFRYPVPGDPIGFIGLKNPSGELVLKYER